MEPKLVYLLELTVKPDKVKQFEDSFDKFWKVHYEHRNGKGHLMKFYKSMVSSNGIEVVAMVFIDSFSDMDFFQHTPEMIIDHYGYEKGVKIMNLYADAILTQKSRMLKLFDVNTKIEF